MNTPRPLLLLLGLCALAPALSLAADYRLEGKRITADFDATGLTRLELVRPSYIKLPATLDLANDSASLTVDGERLAVPGLKLTGIQQEPERLTYTHACGDRQLQVIYELKPDWQFVSKHLVLTMPAGSTARVEAVELFRSDLKTPVTREIKASDPSGAVFLRLGDPAARWPYGAFLALQNPFLEWERGDSRVAMRYQPVMEWRGDWGPFTSDRVCIGLQTLANTDVPMRSLAEWKYLRDPESAFEGVPALDEMECRAMTRCVSAFTLCRPEKSLRVHVPWCENDYQIDIATPAGRAEWKRILDQCASVGVDHSLFTPANSEIAPLGDNTDAWAWENLLWLGLGQKIRRGEWDIAKDPIPPAVQEMLDYAKAKNIKLMAYVYPTLGWKQDPEWTAWCGGKTGGYVGVDSGVRSFQDWFVDQLVAFQERTGIGGYCFDHWWIDYAPTSEGARPTSKYAQWNGCRRILEELRRRIPDLVIDGRQQYQWYGPWTWLGGSYPHPTTTDEQPGSFENFPDLHLSRVSADRQRRASWYYHTEQFTPWELVPGFITHQTPRNDADGRCVRERAFHSRDWDVLGWRYSVISSIGTAPFNHVVNLLPARDETEFRHFLPAEQQWLKGWLDWTDENRELLKKLRPISGPPVLGCIDGTAAIDGDHGVIFLFNPSYRELEARFTLPEIGLGVDIEYMVRELHPQAGRLIGRPGGDLWRFGKQVKLSIKGPAALVLEVLPAGGVKLPALIGATGKIAVDGKRVVLTEVRGETGRSTELALWLPGHPKITKVSINGRELPVLRPGSWSLWTRVPITFAGERVDHCPQVGAYDPDFADRVFRADLTVPQQVFDQLAARRRAWPVDYTQQELLATWRGSDRLLLFIQIADPCDTWQVGLKIDGRPVEVKKAYSDVFPLGRERTFTGFYADISKLQADTPHQVEVELPPGLQPGQFQGLFLENVAAQFTDKLAK